jgi:hypothetical protein
MGQTPLLRRHEFEKLSRLKRANDHTAGCPRYLGRTSSYMEFGEVAGGDDKLGEVS